MPSQGIVGTSVYRFIAPESEITFKALLENGIGKGEIKLQAESGISLPVYLSINSLWTKEFPNAWCIVVTDMTELKKAEGELLESEARFKADLENSSVIAWMKDEEGLHTFLSSNYEK